ncbi:hypothetical protein GF343_05230 [Candidatus Woesearchaeota archaeon]|nr:hypothetical protein [Candidatus Woesearchaeota archaeon]
MISVKEKKKYPMPEKDDFVILDLIHDLEKHRMSSTEKFIVLWTRTQLEDDWRKPLIQILQVMKKNINKPSKERLKKIQEFADKNFWRP